MRAERYPLRARLEDDAAAHPGESMIPPLQAANTYFWKEKPRIRGYPHGRTHFSQQPLRCIIVASAFSVPRALIPYAC